MNQKGPLCVVDTNVPVTASMRPDASAECVRACVAAVEDIMHSKCLALDDGWRIIREYRANLSQTGQPGVGDRFLLWVLQNYANPDRCACVSITPLDSDPREFGEFPRHPKLEDFHLSDRKFVAVAAAHPARPPILQAFDSKWWGWKDALAECGVAVQFLCEHEIARKYLEKHG